MTIIITTEIIFESDHSEEVNQVIADELCMEATKALNTHMTGVAGVSEWTCQSDSHVED